MVVPVQSTQECAHGHHPAEDMGVKGESGITVHNGIQIKPLLILAKATELRLWGHAQRSAHPVVFGKHNRIEHSLLLPGL